MFKRRQTSSYQTQTMKFQVTTVHNQLQTLTSQRHQIYKIPNIPRFHCSNIRKHSLLPAQLISNRVAVLTAVSTHSSTIRFCRSTGYLAGKFVVWCRRVSRPCSECISFLPQIRRNLANDGALLESRSPDTAILVDQTGHDTGIMRWV